MFLFIYVNTRSQATGDSIAKTVYNILNYGARSDSKTCNTKAIQSAVDDCQPIHISSIPGLGSSESGSIRNLRFSNISATSESGILIYAWKKGLIRDIYFDHVDLTIKPGALTTAYGGNIDRRPVNNTDLGIFSHSIPAFYSSLTDELVIRDLNVRWENGLPAYFDHAVECAGFESLTIDGLNEHYINKKQNGTEATVYLQNGRIARIRDIRSSDEKKKLLKKDNVIHLISE